MTRKLISIKLPVLLLAFAFVGISYASASEVTGVLSSDTVGSAQTSGADGSISGTVAESGGSNGSITGTVTDGSSDGSISGTVTGSSGGSSSGGSSRSRSSGSSSDSPEGAVLGATTVRSPTFPNAGSEPDGTSSKGIAITAIALMALLALGTARMSKYTS